MHDLRKTAVFAAVACLSVAAALAAGWMNAPQPVSDDDTGQTFYPSFTDPFRVASLEIVRFDLDSNLPVMFRVAQNEQGDWVIPSKENYPVRDASRLAAVANALIGRTKLSYVRGDEAAEHATYGVLDPEAVRPAAQDDHTDEDVGAKATLYDSAGHVLAAFVIGKPVPDQPPATGPEMLRYVRDPLTDRVYTTRLDASVLTTRFADWVDQELVALRPDAVRGIVVDDHSVNIRPNETIEFKLPDRTERRPLYNMIPRAAFEVLHNPERAGARAFDVPSAEAELGEKHVGRLRQLLAALADVRFIDVAAIKAKVGPALVRGEPLSLDQEGTLDMIDHGFFPVSPTELFAKEGAIVVQLVAGVSITLQFGNAALVDRRNLGGEDNQAAGGEADTGRYVLVSARFDRTAIPQPTLKPEPDPGKRLADDAPPKEVFEQFAAIEREGLMSSAEIKTLRDRVEQDNKTQQEAYDGKVKAAQGFVDFINERCQGWYYVIPNETFSALRLQRSDLPLPQSRAKGPSRG